MNYNLIVERWIPVLYADGTVAQVGILEALPNAGGEGAPSNASHFASPPPYGAMSRTARRFRRIFLHRHMSCDR